MPPPRKSHNPTQAAVEQAAENIFKKGLPSSPEAEKFCLGSVLLDDSKWVAIAELPEGVFSLEAYRRIWERMRDVHDRGDQINRTTLVDELRKHGQLESIGGISGIMDLDAGLPTLPEITSYINLIREKHALRSIIWDAQRRIDQALAGAESKDIAAAGLASLQEIQDSGNKEEDIGQSAESIITSYPGGAAAFLDPSQRAKGLPSSFVKLDEMLGGFQNGELIILAARPSQGKTALAMNIAGHLALHHKQRRPVSVFSLETTGPSLLTRMVCAGARVDAHKFRAGFLNADERHRLHVELYNITTSRLRIYDKFGITVPEIIKHVRRDVKDLGTCMVFIDYLQILGVKKKGENRNIDVSEMSRQLKILAGECNIPVMVLSQLSRANEKRTGGAQRPQLSDLRDSGAIEQDADVVLAIHREEVYKRDREDLRGLADLIILKQRNGPIGDVPLRFIHNFTRFENRSEDLMDSQEETPYNGD